MTISNFARKSKLTFEDVRNQLLNEDIIRKYYGQDKPGGSALSVDLRGRSKEKGSNNRGRSTSKSRSKSRSIKGSTCWHYKKVGHMKVKCSQLKGKGNGQKS